MQEEIDHSLSEVARELLLGRPSIPDKSSKTVVFRRYEKLSDEKRKEIGFLPESEEIRLGVSPASVAIRDEFFLRYEDIEVEIDR